MNAPLRIGLLTPAWPGHSTANGITTSVFHLANGLSEIGHRPVIISGRIEDERPDDIALVQTRQAPWSLVDRARAKLNPGSADAISRGKWMGMIAEAIREAQRVHGLDIVILEETFGWASGIIPKVTIPVLLCLHGPWVLLSRAFERELTKRDHERISLEARAFARVPGLIAPSASSMAVTEGIVPDTPRAVIPNAYPVGPAPDPARRKPGHILFVGRVDRLKGADIVLRAFALLAERHAGARLTFAGPDRGLLLDDGRTVTMDEALADLPEAVRARIDYLGSQNSATIADLRKSHPIALTASRYENLNYTLLEAMAAGQAIVATEVGGPAEVLKDGVTASLVPPGDAPAMADALDRMLSDPAHAAALADAAQRQIASDFAPAVIAERTVAFCRDVLAQRSQS